MIFCIKADAGFEAEDIVDAFRKLSEHFRALADEMEDDEGSEQHDTHLFIGGSIKISPCRVDSQEPDGQNATPQSLC